MAKRKRKPPVPPRPAERQPIVHVANVIRAPVRAKYDAAQNVEDNRRHWANADALSPDAAASPTVRQALRNNCRYEYANNSYCKGIVDTLATDAVGGTGPRLQMATGDDGLDTAIEDDFAAWAAEVGLAEILRTMRAARAHSGEAFGLIGTNRGIEHDVKLNVQLVEAEQVTEPFAAVPDSSLADGIEFDQYGNPETYNVLRDHPGGMGAWGVFGDDQFDRWPAKFVLHYYRPDRPGQRRGVPDLTPAVQLFAELRRYAAAVIASAETAADYAAILKTPSPQDGEPASDTNSKLGPFDLFPLTKRMGMIAPDGYDLTQLKSEQPITTYGDFIDKKLEEICRCLGVPWTIGALNSSKANMSASYLDGQRYSNSVAVDRARLEFQLNRLFAAWLAEWQLVRSVREIPVGAQRQWFWPSMGHHADPNKVASARTEGLSNGTATLPREYAKEGLDYAKELESESRALGIPLRKLQDLIIQKRYGPAPAAPPPGEGPDDEGDPLARRNGNGQAATNGNGRTQ